MYWARLKTNSLTLEEWCIISKVQASQQNVIVWLTSKFKDKSRIWETDIRRNCQSNGRAKLFSQEKEGHDRQDDWRLFNVHIKPKYAKARIRSKIT